MDKVIIQIPLDVDRKTGGVTGSGSGITPATVNKALGHLEQLGIVKELTAQKRNRLFSYADYIEIMNRGTELPSR